MNAAAARLYIRAHYVLLLAAATIALGWYALHEHDARIRNETLWKEKYSAADSTLQARDRELGIARGRTDTVTRTVTRLLASVAADSGWRRDAVYIAGDSTPRYAVPIASVLRQDSTNAACSLLAVTCKAERVAADNRAAAAEHQLQLALNKPQRSCALPSLLSAALGASAGFYVRSKLP